MKIGIGADHGGIILKKEIITLLEEKGYTAINYGTDTEESVDYPDYAFAVAEAVRDQKIDLGILICRTGIGMSIAANKVSGVRCAKVSSREEATLSRQHNFANCMAISGNLSSEEAKRIVLAFVETTPSTEERHKKRVDKINAYRG